MRLPYQSWGRYPAARPSAVVPLFWRDDAPDFGAVTTSVLPYGLGRSYGDSCLNDGGVLLDTTGLSRFLAFDQTTGMLRCEAGVTLEEILELLLPQGWFLPVTPGTKYVTVGGAIANDVHGKNHHGSGTFGCHVTRFELLRSSGERLECSPVANTELFEATIGGLGLTGLITWAELRMQPVPGPYLMTETVPFRDLDHFIDLSGRSDESSTYTMSWIDCLAPRGKLGRGVLFRGNHAETPARLRSAARRRQLRMPIELPVTPLNRATISVFNAVYRTSQSLRAGRRLTHYDPFFYPLDSVRDWNRFYGRRGFFQHQFVVPPSDRHEALRDILGVIARSGEGSFLAVMKEFGTRPSPGMLSFPRPGVTLALDFANRGARTLRLLDQLDGIVASAGGAVYPAKDARMAPAMFARGFPRWREFASLVDPRFSSSFWRRVTRPA